MPLGSCQRFRLLLPSVLIFFSALPAAAEDRIPFIGVEVSLESKKIDEKLYKYLERKAGISFQAETMPYGASVHEFVSLSDHNRPFLARMTPYVYVVSEMLGAKLEVLATYKTKAGTTYQSYFVVNRDDLSLVNGKNFSEAEPELSDLIRYLELRKKQADKFPPARFIYHSKFSTSSYFLPSLYFRGHHVFSMSQSPSGSLIPIQVEKAGADSNFLVREVAGGKANLAAVWDGTKDKFTKKDSEDYKAYGSRVHFIPLPEVIPNDLLVWSSSDREIFQEKKKKIQVAIRSMPEPESADKDSLIWQDIKDAHEAMEALARLRRAAMERAGVATVKISGAVPKKLIDAAEYAVRLSGAEFVLFDEDFHKRPDFVWELESAHDGAIHLTSTMEGFHLPPQHKTFSFVNEDDLTKRMADFVQSRMYRIRYVWPYQEKHPTIIRDVSFSPARDPVWVQRISWIDVERNEYERDEPFNARIVKVDFRKFQLSDEANFPRELDGTFHFEPMSNVIYRVVLVRPEQETRLAKGLTGGFVVLLFLLCGGLVWDLRRHRPPPVGFRQSYQSLVDRYHQPWRVRQIDEAEVLWCHPEIGKLIKKLRRDGWLAGLGDEAKVDIPVVPVRIPWAWLRRTLYRLFGRRLKLPPELLDPSDVENNVALESVIQTLVARRRLSPFLGSPLEWEALDEMTVHNFRGLDVGQGAAEARLQRDSRELSALAASHFREVMNHSKHDLSLFRRTWEVQGNGNGYHLTHRAALAADLRLAGDLDAVSVLNVEFDVPAGSSLSDYLSDQKLDAWLLGQWDGVRRTHGDNGLRRLCLRFRPVALLRDTSAQQ